jgi:Domain of unknown function (DUF4262)
MTPVEQQIVEGVDKNGWFVVTYVPESDAENADEWFSYTVGLTKTAGWPEIICFGLDQDRSTDLLRETIGECWKRRIRPAAGVELTEVLRGHTARLQRADDLRAPYFEMADWYAEHSGTEKLGERLQLVWPDRDGRFPSDFGCDPEVRERQTPKARG